MLELSPNGFAACGWEASFDFAEPLTRGKSWTLPFFPVLTGQCLMLLSLILAGVTQSESL